MLTQIGATIGPLICLYSVIFRWKSLIAEYGRLSLYWWVVAVTVGCTLLGYLADVALWNFMR